MSRRTKLTSLFVFLFAMLLAAQTLSACSCSETEYYERLDQTGGENTAQTQAASSSDAAQETWSKSCPQFRSGSYSMVSANSTVQTTANDSAASYYRSDQEYDYDLALTVNADGSIDCVYTFTRVSWSYTMNDETYKMDTSDPAGNNSSTAMYYDLVGCSFTAHADPQLNVTGVTGVNEIVAAHPSAASLISEENLLALAKDLFYKLPDKFEKGTSWRLNQNGVPTDYVLMQHRGGEFAADISGGEQPLPSPSYDPSTGFTTSYTNIDKLTGTLRMNEGDRCIQNFSYRQTSRGTLTSQSENYAFEVVVSSSCKITAKNAV